MDNVKIIDNIEKRKPDKNESYFFRIYQKLFKKNSTYKQLILWYLLITIIGAVLLYLPVTQKNSWDEDIGFLNVLFISASSFSDTGLTVLSISDAYNFFGQAIIFILIMLGGIGWFTFKYFIITYIFFKTSKRKTETEARDELGETSNNEAKEIVKVALFSMFTMIIIFGIIFGIIFALTVPQNPYGFSSGLKDNWDQAMWVGFFHANSAINNAGFDIFAHNNSLGEYYNNYLIQILTMFLFIFGGIGFAVIYDVIKNIKRKKDGKQIRFSLFTKISVLTYFVVAFGGLFLVYIFEGISYAINSSDSFFGNPSSNLGNNGEKMWALTFNTFSTRNAGFSTIDLSLLSIPSQLTHSLMMFIGSGPGSTAGGIRTTATAVLIVYLVSLFRTKEKKNTIFGKKISEETIKLSKKIFIFSISFILIIFMVILIEDVFVKDQIKAIDSLYITMSAFGTTGLSTVGYIPFSETTSQILELGVATRLSLIFTMIIGQIGMANLIKVTSNGNNPIKDRKINYSIYLEETVNLG